jgi:hypothetical protein
MEPLKGNLMDKNQPHVEGDVNPQLAVVEAAATDGKIELLAKDVIKKAQDGIRRSLVKLDTSIHANAVQCLLHAEKNGDTSLMRRLLVDIIDAKSGYRRQGIIAWMREFSPMELHGDIIKLTGTINGERRPFRVEEANKTPFTDLASAKEMVELRPVFRDNLIGPLDRAIKSYRASVENTKIENGKVVGPIDPKKPFYNGLHLNKMDEGFDAIQKIVGDMMSFGDNTKDVFDAREALRKAQLEANDVGATDATDVAEVAKEAGVDTPEKALEEANNN